MNKIKKYFFVMGGFFFLLGLSSCKKDRLEEFFVQAEENPDYILMSLPISTIEIDESKLDQETLNQIKTVRKINLLLYKPAKKEDISRNEFEKLEKILDAPKYKKLLTVINEGRKLEFVYQGSPKNINKLTFLGRDSLGYFILGFVKAKKLSVDALFKTLKNVNRVDNHHIKEFLNEFSQQTEEK
jgi:hypothetical protein